MISKVWKDVWRLEFKQYASLEDERNDDSRHIHKTTTPGPGKDLTARKHLLLAGLHLNSESLISGKMMTTHVWVFQNLVKNTTRRRQSNKKH